MTKIATWEELSKVKTGDKLRVIKTDNDIYLPVDFIATVEGVPRGESYLTLLDDLNSTHYIHDFDVHEGVFAFEKVTSKGVTNNPTTTTLAKRKAAAKAIRKAEKNLIALMESLGNELNLEIDYSVDIDISYDAPREEY